MDTTESLIERKKGGGGRFNRSFVEIAARIMSSGGTEEDVRKELNIRTATFDRWKNQFPTFELAITDADNVMVNLLLEKAAEYATGFDYDEVTRYYRTIWETDKDGKTKEKEILEKKVVKTKRQAANTELLKFLLVNKAGFKTSNDEKTEKSLSVSIESSDVRGFIDQLGSGWANEQKRKAVENENSGS